VRTEGLPFDRLEGVGDDVGAPDVPAWCEARLVGHQRSVRVRDDLVAVADDEMARAAADVDAVVGVGGVPEDPLVLFVEGVRRAPREGDRVT
jgi:hypothetical protein